MIHSLRGRLLAGIVAGMIILLSAFSVLIYSVIRHYMIGQFDTSLLSTAQMLAAVMEDEQYENSQADDDADRNKTKNNERLEFNLDVRMIPEFNRVSGAAYYQFQQPNGTIFLRSPTLTAEQRLETATVSEHPEYRQTLLPGNKIARMVGIWFVPHSGGRDREFEFTESENQMLGLTVARDATGLFEKLTLLKLLLGGGCFCIIVLSVGIAFLTVRTGLRPLYGLAGAIADVNVNTLQNRFETASLPVEMTGVVSKLNELLDRLAESFERERCFTSDVAHELRTPLAGIRSALEVALSRQRQAPQYQEAMTDCLAVVGGMQQLVNKLLSLARLDSGQFRLAPENVNVADLADFCWKSFAEDAQQCGIRFENRISAGLMYRTDKEYLAMVLNNLMENAADYTDGEGKISIESAVSGNGHIEITMTNTGCKLTADEAQKVFDRFWRVDASRYDTGLHCGLGLALVEKIVTTLLGGRIQARVHNGLFVMHLNLPADKNPPIQID